MDNTDKADKADKAGKAAKAEAAIRGHLRHLSSTLGAHWENPLTPRRRSQPWTSASPASRSSRQPSEPLASPDPESSPASQPSSKSDAQSHSKSQSKSWSKSGSQSHLRSHSASQLEPGAEPRPIDGSSSSSYTQLPAQPLAPPLTSPDPKPDPKPAAAEPLPAMSSRGNQRRGPNRNSEVGEPGEEVAMWKEVKDKLGGVVDAFNQSSSNVAAMHEQEKVCAERKKSNTLRMEDLNRLDQLSRQGVKHNEAALQAIQENIEKLNVLRAVVKANEEAQEASSSQPGPRRQGKDLYEFEAGDSPVPSPNHNPRARATGKDRGDSVPPKPDRSTPVGTVDNNRSKQIFAKDDEVAFKPKQGGNEQTDWILGIVQEVRGEGKSRRYKVLDADFEGYHTQKDYRMSASSMILIPKEGTVLPPLEEGKIVLALYPNTTTFYKAEVMGMDGDKKVHLKFEGEESSNTMQAVTRRHVVEYRA
ncbi:SGF29 tudor-like domain-containing protein [Xylariaceae sp. FL0594]|nr:SGF29 tudor-like domain-containing protein [Xylariaceae sp. FL0594]